MLPRLTGVDRYSLFIALEATRDESPLVMLFSRVLTGACARAGFDVRHGRTPSNFVLWLCR